jgi:hypothetical protein
MYALGVPETPGGGRFRDVPEWYGPPHMIGGHVTGPVVIGRSDRLVVAARQVLAFPAGVQVEVEAHARGSWDVREAGTSPENLDRGADDLRFWLQFSDGREAAQDDEAGLRDGRGPVLFVRGYESSSGGPDDPKDVRLTLWAWPLPPSGAVTLTCSWPGHGLRDASILLDGDAIRAAARQAQPFWPVPGA